MPYGARGSCKTRPEGHERRTLSVPQTTNNMKIRFTDRILSIDRNAVRAAAAADGDLESFACLVTALGLGVAVPAHDVIGKARFAGIRHEPKMRDVRLANDSSKYGFAATWARRQPVTVESPEDLTWSAVRVEALPDVWSWAACAPTALTNGCTPLLLTRGRLAPWHQAAVQLGAYDIALNFDAFGVDVCVPEFQLARAKLKLSRSWHPLDEWRASRTPNRVTVAELCAAMGEMGA